ncbi:uncharacterized protein LOC135136251 [Zophobas morio]
MKYIFVALALFSVFSSFRCDSSGEVIDTVKSKHVKKLLSKNKEHVDEGLEKLEQHCPGVTNKLKEAIKSFVECDDKVDDALTICQQIQTSSINCTAPLFKVVDDCLPPKARGLPTLGLKSLVSVADFLCKQNGETIFELANPCLWGFAIVDAENESNVTTECDKKFATVIEEVNGLIEQNNPEQIPTKTEICNTITGFRSCVKTETVASCKCQKTQDAAIGLFDAFVAPCSHINEV